MGSPASPGSPDIPECPMPLAQGGAPPEGTRDYSWGECDGENRTPQIFAPARFNSVCDGIMTGTLARGPCSSCAAAQPCLDNRGMHPSLFPAPCPLPQWASTTECGCWQRGWRGGETTAKVGRWLGMSMILVLLICAVAVLSPALFSVCIYVAL